MLELASHGAVQRFRLARRILGRGWYHTSAYFIDGLLIDTGCAHTATELAAALATTPPHTVVNTHRHEDHIGGNAAIATRFGARILASPLALPTIADPVGRQPEQLYRRVFWGYPQPSLAAPIGEVVETEHFTFRVILTPGHCADHIALFEPREGLLFVGDAFVGGQDRAIRREANIWQVIASLETLGRLDARLLCPGSGTVYDHPARHIARKLDCLRHIGDLIRKGYAAGLPLPQICRQVLGREPAIAWLTQNDFRSIHLVRSFIHDEPPAPRTPPGP